MEFLTNGIPDGVAEAANLVQVSNNNATTTPAATATGNAPLQRLRNHPQFDALRRLVQSNPAMLSQVLTQIGQQQPDLLQEINANQALFLQMMNEPIAENAAATTTNAGSSSGTAATATSGASSTGGGDAAMPGMMGGNAAQMAQMIQSMGEPELQQMAQMMGLSVDQLRQTAQMIQQLPPEQLNDFMMQAMGGGGGGGQQVLRLTAEEMAAVDRLTEMGFDRSEAAQAFLACDKNEALAANLLMDSMGDGGGLFGAGSGGGNDDNDGDGGGNDDNDDDENMYD
jgi:UV excision repair protein RAD23